jgi:hypothetical protein
MLDLEDYLLEYNGMWLSEDLKFKNSVLYTLDFFMIQFYSKLTLD